MTTNVYSDASQSNAFSALGEALESAADSIGHARADATEHAKLAARRVHVGVNQGAYYTAYGISYSLVFAGVFLKELLPVSNPIRRGFEDGAVAAIGAAERTAAALAEGPAAPQALADENAGNNNKNYTPQA